jgi:succinyl-CoA synthetase alpha subunit
MSIFLNKGSKVIVQGMTGAEGTRHTTRMLASGTDIVGGVTPGKGGRSVDFDGKTIPVYGAVAEAVEATGAKCRWCSSRRGSPRAPLSRRSTPAYRWWW